MASKTFNVGVVGYGMSAKVFHIPFVKVTPLLKLHSILQRSPKPTDSAPSDYPDLKHHTTYDSFLADPELDLVVLSTTPPTHFELASKALKAGKHVLCEKPFVPTAAEADKLVAIARDNKRVLCVYQNRRWDADYATVKKLIQDGTLGRIVEFETHFDRYRAEKPTNWKATTKMSEGGGMLYDLGTHLIDQVYALFGKPASVFAKFVNTRDGVIKAPEDETDSATVQLFYNNGLVVLVRIGVLSVESQQPRFWIRGTKGSYHKFNLDTQEPELKDFNAGKPNSRSPLDENFGVEPADWAGKLTTLGEDGKTKEQSYPTVKPPTYKEFYRLLAASIASGKEEDVPVPAAQASEVLKIIEAVRESNKTGREVPLS
ncbi:oxidoreductase [Truncatella angustata]|uniref:Oxidoreductase n=1 Tax=Truncatella angustata TaxID=152316 RepID=A0A9P8ZYH8_9PEZI|nr:oxidoreductase [Truncatella angustata]KAH6655177.1 oxidoreductase [Truncatella angustata]